MLETLKSFGNDKYARKHIVQTDFRAHFMAASRSGGALAGIDVTPEMAGVMLERNTKNRPCRRQTVAHYARQMSEGKWHYTRVPVIFSIDGVLIDGQHRLRAIIESGATVKMDLAFGAPADSFSFIDVGKGRSASDIFSIHGVKNSSLMAAAVRWVVGYETNTLNAKGGGAYTADELYEFYQNHEGLQDSYHAAWLFSKTRLAPPAMMCALHYLMAKKNRAQADAFFEGVAEGVGLTKGAPALALRNKLILNASSDEKRSPRKMAGLTVRAWAKVREGVPVSTLKFKDDDVFPRIK